MIIDHIFYGVKCNRCHSIYNDTEDRSYHWDESSAVEQAMDDEWIEVGNKHYCPGCYTQGEDDVEPTIKPKYPDYIWKAEQFLLYISSTPASITEDEQTGNFILRGFTPGRMKSLGKAEVEWLMSFLGENLISIYYEDKERCSNAEFFIVIKNS